MSDIQGTIMRLISAPILDDPPSDCNHTQNYIAEAVNAEKQLWKLIHSKGLSHIDVQKLYHKARSTYEKIILNDTELPEHQDIEYSLWKLHYKQIDEYRNRIRGSSVTKECINSATAEHVIPVQRRSDHYLEEFLSFLSEATEFYHHLIKKIRRGYGLSEELLFFKEGGLLSSMVSTRLQRCQFSCHRCLVCLGDLARYRELYANPDGQIRSWSVSATHYLNAASIWPDSGNPHNQLAVLAIYVGDELLALYHCIRSLAVKEPFPDAWDNLILLFEKNRSSHLLSLSNLATFNFSKPYERITVDVKMQSSDTFSNGQLRVATEDRLTGGTELWSLIVRMISYFYVKPSSEDFLCIFGSTIRELEALLSLDDKKLLVVLESYQHMDVARTGPFRVLQLVSTLIFTIHTLSGRSQLEKPKYMKYMQQPSLLPQAFTTTFIFMGRLVNRCMTAYPRHSSSLLPGILVFVEWLVDMFDTLQNYATDDKCASAISYFFDAFVDLLNQFDEGGEVDSLGLCVLWEDKELEGFSPISHFHGSSDFKRQQETRNGSDETSESEIRIHRISVAAMKIVNKSIGSQKWIYHGKTEKKFYTPESTKMSGRKEPVIAGLDLKVRKSPQHFHVFKDVPPLQGSLQACDLPGNEVGEEGLDVHRSVPVEEEEVILFKPITRYNSAPLYLPLMTSCHVSGEGDSNLATSSGECSHSEFSLDLPRKETFTDPNPLNRCSSITGSSNKKLWDDPIPEDSVMDSFMESTDSPRFRALSAEADEIPPLAGPPSLSAWVGNQDGYRIAGAKGSKEASGHSSSGMEDIVSAYVSGLSISGNGVSQQDVTITSSTPASSFMHGSTYDRDTGNSCRNASAYDFYEAPPYMPPAPSAPLLPDDATWFTGKSSNSAENENMEDAKGFFPTTTQLNIYANSSMAQGPPNFNPNPLTFSDAYTPYPGQTSSAQWLDHYQAIPEQAHGNILPGQLYMPAAFGRFQNNNVSTSVLHQTRNLEDLSFYPGFISPSGEQKKEGHFAGYPGPRPFGYGAVKDLRSEQQLLLKYLKEKEWHLQQEAQLRGSA